MNRIIKTARRAAKYALVLSLPLLLAAGCKTRLIDYTIISSKNVDISKIGGFKRASDRAQGQDIAYVILFFPTGTPNLKEAIDTAIEGVPGAVALADGVVYSEGGYFVLGGYSAYTVEGTALIDPALTGGKQAMKSKYIIGGYNTITKKYECNFVDEAAYNSAKQRLAGKRSAI